MVLPQISLVSLRPTNTALSENASSIPSCRKEQEINYKASSVPFSAAKCCYARYLVLEMRYEAGICTIACEQRE